MDILGSTGKKGKWQFKWTSLVNERMKRAWAARTARKVDTVNILKEWNCDRENLARQVREQLSRKVTRSLQRCLDTQKDGGSLVVPLSEEEEIDAKRFACILRVKGGESEHAKENRSGLLQYEVDEEDAGDLLVEPESTMFGLTKHEANAPLMMDLQRLQDFLGRT